MTEKMLTFPSPTSKDLVDGVNRSQFNFFPEQHQHKPTKTFVPGQYARLQNFFCQGEGGGGGGSRLLNLFYSLQRGPMVLLHIFQGSNFFQGGPNANFYRNPCNYNLWFSRGVWTPIPLWIRKCTMWHLGTNMLRRACAASF